MARALRFVALAALLAIQALAHHDFMSRAFVAEAIPATDVVLVASTTEGPYSEAETDYVTSPDMTAAAIAGSAGVTTNRTSVLNAIPLTLTIRAYSVSGTTANELSNAEIFVWHCDALGVYSAVPIAQQRSEDTVGQKWSRGRQVTDVSGSVTFKTIIPGWYTGRAVHYHVRVRLPGASAYAVTTQFFISDAVVNTIKTLAPYSSDTQTIQVLSTDSVYTSVSSSVRDALVLSLTGSPSAGYTAAFNVGIAGAATPAPTTTALQPPPTTSTVATTSTPTTTAAGLAPTTTAAALANATTASPSTISATRLNSSSGLAYSIYISVAAAVVALWL